MVTSRAFYFTFLAAAVAPVLLVRGVKIAFVGDTGMEDPEYMGYGDLTMEMIDNEGIDLVVDVGDFDYWGRCTETYEVKSDLSLKSLSGGEKLEVPTKSTLKRITWQDGRHGSTKGWEIGVQPDVESIAVSKKLAIDGDLFQRLVIPEKTWEEIVSSLKFQKGERDCEGEPWDGSWEWNQFVRDHSFDFLGASGNAEVKEAPEYGSAEIWDSHQRYMHALYMERIYNNQRGACHGYFDQSEPGTVNEYGERFSCYYNSNNGKEDFQFLFLGWWEGSNERTDNGSVEDRKKTLDFIEREFSDERSQNVRWRFCIHHMTSAKLSGGGRDREVMVLAKITDACRKHGALIISGHHHLYSRTTMLKSVGSESGEDPVPVATDADKSKFVIKEGRTMSITTGMGGYDGGCNGKYANATWMDKCIARPSDHRGAIIAEFPEDNTRIGSFRYMNSLQNGKVVDEFQITSRLPGSIDNPTSKPTREPSRKPSQSPTETATKKPTREPASEPETKKPTGEPMVPQSIPTPEVNLTDEPETQKPQGKPTSKPTKEPASDTNPEREPETKKPTQKPTSKPISKPKPTEVDKDSSDGECILVLDALCGDDRLTKFCGLIKELDLVDSFSPYANTSLTVFAPTNEAFAALENNEAFGVLNTEESEYILLYHAVYTEGDPLKYDDLECNGLVATANGKDHRTKCEGSSKFQKGQKQMDGMLPMIIDRDIKTCSSLVHVVENVILPDLSRLPGNNVNAPTKNPTQKPTYKSFAEVFTGI